MNYDKKFSDSKHKLTSFMRPSNGLNDGNNEFYNTPVTDNVSVDIGVALDSHTQIRDRDYSHDEDKSEFFITQN